MLVDYSELYFQFSEKRVKERSVLDAFQRVKQWRSIYEQGKTQENQNKKRFTLQDAANLVKIPKKTLEDYNQIFNKVDLICQIEEFSNKKMGFLRQYIRKNKAKIKRAAQIKKQIKKQTFVKLEGSSTEDNILDIEQDSYSCNWFLTQKRNKQQNNFQVEYQSLC